MLNIIVIDTISFANVRVQNKLALQDSDLIILKFSKNSHSVDFIFFNFFQASYVSFRCKFLATNVAINRAQ